MEAVPTILTVPVPVRSSLGSLTTKLKIILLRFEEEVHSDPQRSLTYAPDVVFALYVGDGEYHALVEITIKV